MVAAPGTQRRGSVVSGIDEDEDGPAGLQCDRKLQRERVPGLPHRSPIHPQRVAPTFVLKYNIRTRSLADPGAIEDVLTVENDVVPFDRADVLRAALR